MLFKHNTNESKNLHISVTPSLIAIFFLFIHENITYDKSQDKTLLHNHLELKKLKSESDYIVSTKGLFIGIDVKKEKYDFKSKKGIPRLILVSQRRRDAEFGYVQVKLDNRWIMLFSFLSQLYTNKESLKFINSGYSYNTFIFDGLYGTKSCKVEFVFETKKSSGYKITQLKIRKIIGEDKKIVLGIALYRNTLGEFLRKVISSVSCINGFISKLKHQKFNDVALGIRGTSKGTVCTDMDMDELFKEYQFLSVSDCLMLYSSARNRILQGYWIAFQGETISIDNSGYLTTLKREYSLESNFRTKGATTALMFIAALGFKGA